MNAAAILLYPFDWRGVLSRGAYRRNASILVLVGLIINRLDLLPGMASLVWTAAAAAMGLSFDARRYHDIGRSAAWIVWANLIAAALTIAAFQFFPNMLGSVPLPERWRPDAAGEAILGRFALPAFAGVILGNIAQSIWLASAPSAAGDNPYAHAAARPRAAAAPEDDGPDEATLQAIIDRHIAQRQFETAEAPAAPNRPSAGAFPAKARQFGRRGL